MSDPVCEARGIPEHLHQEGQLRLESFAPNERLLRRFNYKGGDDPYLTISFERRQSSSNLESLCRDPSDVLYNDETGEKSSKHGVLSFLASALGQESFVADGVKEKYSILVRHDPRRCNFAHADFVILKDGKETDNIKPGSIKQRIRDRLRAHGFLKIELAPPPGDDG